MEDNVNASRPAEAPLESWKEIAAHLKRDVRTVKRWEKSQGLPVHRHLHQSRSTVYAYASELDRWWATRRPAEEAAGVLPGVLNRWPARALAFAAMLTMTVLTAGSGLVTPMSTAAQKPEVVLKRAWSDNRTDATGAPSPDGRYVSYVHWMTANLAVRDMVTGETRDVTTEGTWNTPDQFAYYSVWAPDGRSIAYTWFNKDVHELRIVGLDGGQPRVLVRNKELTWIQPMSWSRDGQFILAQFRTLERVNQIVLVSVADGTSRVVKSLDWRWPQRMSLSPDGRSIVYDFPPNETARQREIYLLAADGSGERVLVEHPADDYAPVWTPDGQGVVFLSNRAGAVGAWMVDVSAGHAAAEPRLIKPDMGRLTPLGFTSEGTLFYGVASYENGGDVMVATLDLPTGGVAQSPRRAIQKFEGHNTSADWSPDGKQLAFLSRRGHLPWGPGSWVIVVRSVETGEERELDPPIENVSNPRRAPLRWSPDGQRLLVSGADTKGRIGIFAVDVKTSAAQPVLLGVERAGVEWPVWSPDGKSVVFLRVRRPNAPPTRLHGVISRDVATGKEKSLYVGTDTFALSPDGKALAVRWQERPKSGIRLVPLDGGEPRDLFATEGEYRPQWFTGMIWSRDGRYVLFGQTETQGDTGPVDLWRVSVASGEAQKLGVTLDRIRDLSAHPDGRRFSMTAGPAFNAEVWVMRDFLRNLQASR